MNYQLEMEQIIQGFGDAVPKLLLHSCCAPCSSAVLERLAEYFEITIDYYNPNIDPPAEYHRRAAEQARFITETPRAHTVTFWEAPYQPSDFYAAVKGLEQIPEGGARCFACYALRLRQAARLAKENDFDFFTTTLSISPHKNAAKLNEIGFALQEEFGVRYLPADFKKKEGFKRSTQLAAQYGLYRQDYCGCIFSRRVREDTEAHT
ncbi:MAG: epoxyqueuosine reductase QueH [Ruthenibacterium sp.]